MTMLRAKTGARARLVALLLAACAVAYLGSSFLQGVGALASKPAVMRPQPAPAVSRTGPASMSSWEHAPAFEPWDAETAHAAAGQASAEDQYTGWGVLGASVASFLAGSASVLAYASYQKTGTQDPLRAQLQPAVFQVDPRPRADGTQQDVFDPLGLREDDRIDPAVFSVESMQAPQVNYANEAGVLLVRLTMASLMVHHGLDKLQNAEGFSANVVAKYFGYLPGEAIWWTYIAAITQIVTPAGLAVGICGRLCAFGLFCTMAFATIFHFQATGLEGFPLTVVKEHSYKYELSAAYAAIFLWLTINGPGEISAKRFLPDWLKGL